MALVPINPMTYQEFGRRLNDTIDTITELLEKHQLGNWWNALKRYNFNGANYIQGQNIRNDFHDQLLKAVDLNAKIVIANNILDWGNMNPLSKEMEIHLDKSLNILNNEHTGINDNLYSDRIASISKVYEMWNPNKWVIFDSYCARGLQWIISNYWTALGQDRHVELLRIPWPPGRVGQPLDDFPRLGTRKQAMLGFLYTSWLCRAIANKLNKNENNEIVWQAYHVEMVLFQIGHEV